MAEANRNPAGHGGVGTPREMYRESRRDGGVVQDDPVLQVVPGAKTGNRAIPSASFKRVVILLVIAGLSCLDSRLVTVYLREPDGTGLIDGGHCARGVRTPARGLRAPTLRRRSGTSCSARQGAPFPRADGRDRS